MPKTLNLLQENNYKKIKKISTLICENNFIELDEYLSLKENRFVMFDEYNIYKPVRIRYPLHQAIHYDNIECLKILLKYDYDINYQYLYNTTPIIYAIMYNRIKCVKLLLTHPDININLKYWLIPSPIIYAIDLNRVEIVKLLLETEKIDNNQNILHYLCSNNKLEILLLYIN